MESVRCHHARCAGPAGCAGPTAAQTFELAGTERQYERSRPFLLRHIALDLALDLAGHSVSGSATLDFKRVARDATHLWLDAVAFTIRCVEVHDGDCWASAPFTYDGDGLRVQIPPMLDQGKVRVVYSATPRRGLYFLEPDAEVPNRPRQVWTQCQDEDARHWFPCHDKPHVKMTSELRVSLPAGLVALSNGELVEQSKPAAGPFVYHFRLTEPHPSYLVTLVAGEFDVVQDRAAACPSGKIVPIEYYVPQGRKDDANRSFGETPRMIELFSRLTGVDYPFSRYSQIVVSDFVFGGMENTTATTMYEHVLLDERAALDVTSNDLVAHELAHQWFGDHVTCRDWSHAWLNEGFATFFEHVEREDRLGRDEYDYGIASDFEAYLKEANGRYSRPIVCRDYQAPIDLFDRHLYEKGALVLHMLRRAVGDDLFWQGVRLYLERHARGIVETRDLERAFEEVSGHSLERFFDEWVHRSHHPELKVRVAWEDGQLSTHVSQAQKGKDVAVFAFELEVTVCAPDGTLESHRKSVKSATDVLSLPLPERPRWVAFNPELRVLAAVTLEVPADMLERQLEEAPRACMRWQAAEALGRRHDARAVSALGRALADSSAPWMVRAEAAGALGRIRGSDALRFLVEQAATSHPKVRRAVAGALGAFRSGEAFDALVALLQSDPSYLVRSEAARSIGATRQPGAIDALVPHVDEPSWADCVRAGVLAGIAASRDDRGLSVVVERTRYGFENPGRRAAIGALAKLSDDRRARERLEELLDDPDPHVRIAVIAALESLGRRESMAALRQCLEREGDGRVRRRAREALKALGTSASGTSQRLQDDLESVRGELAELKTRLSKLESRGAEPAPPDARAAKKSEKTSGKQRKAKRPARKVTSRRRR